MLPRFIFFVLIVFLVAIRTTLASDNLDLSQGQVVVKYISKDNVSLHAVKTRKIAIINALARHINIELITHHQLDEKISLQINEHSLDSIFVRLLADHNFILRYKSRSTIENQSTNLWVLQSGSTSLKRDSNRSDIDTQDVKLEKTAKNKTLIIEKIEDLGDFRNSQTIQQLAKLATSKDVDQRLTAAEAFGDIGTAEVIEPLKTLTNDSSPEVRKAAIYALGDIGSNDAAQVLGLTINDENPDVRKLAISELTFIKNDQSVDSLMKFFYQQDTAIQIELLQAITKINTPKARDYLWLLLDYEDILVSTTVYELLKLSAQTSNRDN